MLRTGRNAGWKWRIRTNLQRLLFGYRGSSYHQTFSQWDGTGHHVMHDFSITRCLSAALAAWLKLTQGLDPMLARCCHDCARILTIDEWDCLMILTDEKGFNILELSICRAVNIFLQSHGAAGKTLHRSNWRLQFGQQWPSHGWAFKFWLTLSCKMLRKTG